MSFLSVALLAATLAPENTSPPDAATLAALVRDIRRADYRGERDALSRLATRIDEVKAPALAAYREYWRAFALWRRALNGFNETPFPGDLGADLEAAVEGFRAALGLQPEWIEAKLGMAGAEANLLYLAGEDKPKREAILARFLPVWREITERGQENPRVLWLLGGSQLSAPPPYGGDPARASATYRRGLQAARDEQLRNADLTVPEWVPTWGAAEHLMSLAYVHSHGALTDRDVAQGYADGTLALVPDWHYVRDILVPQIQALPARAR